MQNKRLTLVGKLSLLTGMALMGSLTTYGLTNSVIEYTTLQQVGLVGTLSIGSFIALYVASPREEIPFKEAEICYDDDAMYIEGYTSYSEDLLNRLDQQDDFSHDMAEQVLLNKKHLEQMALYLKGQTNNQPQLQLTGRGEEKYIEV